MSVFPSSQATIDLQVLPTFPANVVATGAVDISKSGLTYTFGLNFQNVTEETSVSDLGKRELLAQDTDTGAFWRIKLSNLPTGKTDWSSIQNKPTEFPPSPHTHPVSQISDATPLGQALVTAAGDAAARGLLGGTIIGSAVFTAPDKATAHAALGVPPNTRTISAGTGLTGGGDLSADRTLSLADMPQATVKGRAAGAGTGAPQDLTTTQILDALGTAQGSIIYRGASNWVALGPGAVGQYLTTFGAGGNPAWTTPSFVDDMAFSTLAMQVADLANQALFLGDSGNRVFDSFATLDYVDVAGATNLDTSTPGELKPALVETVVTIGSVSTSAALGGNTAFDRSTAVPNGITITKIGVYSTAARTVNAKIARRNSATSIDIVVDQSFAHPGGGWADVTLTSPYVVPPTGSYYIGAYATSNPIEVMANSPRILIGGQNPGVGTGIATTEDNAQNYVLRYTRANPANMTVASTAFTAASAPASEKITARIISVDPITLNTDLMMDVSRDGGTTWTQVTLVERYTQPGSVKVIESNSVDVSGQPSGTAPRWRIRTANNKMVEILDMTLYWK